MNDGFGSAVAISGNTAVIGANNGSRNSAYVFAFNGSQWAQQAKLGSRLGFGFRVAISGSTIVVGAPDDAVGGNSQQGAAYVFGWTGSNWTQQAELTSSDGAYKDFFGSAVAISGNTIVAGADGKTVGSNASQGAAYVFTLNGTTWTQQAELIAQDGAAGDTFGFATAISGSAAVIGLPYGKTVGGDTGEGVAYVFTPSPTVPIPSFATWALAGLLGLTGALFMMRRRRVLL